VCAFHGGSAPQVRRAADRRVAQAKAGAFLAGLGIDLEDRDPHQELSRQLSLSAAVAERVQELVAELEDIDQAGEVHPLVKVWAEERDRVAKMAKMAVAAGVKERAAQLSEEQGHLLAEVSMKAIDDPSCALSEDQKLRLRMAMARELRTLDCPAPDQVALARDIIARHDEAVRENPPPSAGTRTLPA